MNMNIEAVVESKRAVLSEADFSENSCSMEAFDAAETRGVRGLVIADADIDDAAVLLGQLEPGTELWFVDSRSDFDDTLHDALSGGYDELHFVGHGQAGSITLGGKALEAEDFNALSGAQVGQPSIHFWSCMTGAGAKGRAFVHRIAEAFGTVVTAFSGLVGAGDKGGSWLPDVFSRADASVALPFGNALAYQHTLQTSALKLISVVTATGVDVQVRLTAGTVIDNADLVLSYDSTKASYTGATGNPALTGWTWASNPDSENPGHLLISGISTSFTPINSTSDIVLARISFTLQQGSTEFGASLASETGLGLGNSSVGLGTLPTLDTIIFSSVPVWETFTPPGELSYAPGATIALDFPVHATDPNGDTITYKASVGQMVGTTFFGVAGVPQIPLTLSNGHLTGSTTVPLQAAAGSYVLRLLADDNTTDTNNGAALDVPFSVTSPDIKIDVNGLPASTPVRASYEMFMDFVLDPAQQSVPGYLASFKVDEDSKGNPVYAYLTDTNKDGMPDHVTDGSGTGTITWSADGIWYFHPISVTGIEDHYGRFAYDATGDGDVVGLYGFDLTPYTLVPDTNSSDKLVSTFKISGTETGKLYDDDGNGVIDRMKDVETWTDQSGQSHTNTNNYQLTWTDAVHWTAHYTEAWTFGSTYDDNGRPATLWFDGSEHTIAWQTRGADNIVATVNFNAQQNGVTVPAVLSLIDSNADNKPDQVMYTDGTVTEYANLVGWTFDANNRPTAVNIVITSDTSSKDLFSGVAFSSNSNPTTILLPSSNTNPLTGDTLTNNSLTFDLGITSAELASAGAIVVKLATGYAGMNTVNVSVASLTFDGSHLTVPLSGTDAVTSQPYYLSPNSGADIFVKVPTGVVVGQTTILKAWQVGNMNNNSYSLSPMTVLANGTGTSGADWITGTVADDSIAAGAGNDIIQWSAGNDTVDAGDGYDKLYLPLSVSSFTKELDAAGVLHLETAISSGGTTPGGSMTIVDAYRITKDAVADSFQIQKMDPAGATVVQTMTLKNAELVAAGSQTFQLKMASGGGQYVSGTPWDDQINLDASSLGNLQGVSGDTGKDLLVLDLGAGYNSLTMVKSGSSYLLKGVLISDGSLVELGHVIPSQYGNGATMTVGTGATAKSFMVYDIESFRFVSGSVFFDVDPSQFADVLFYGNSFQNTIIGTSNADAIDADVLYSTNNATTHNDWINGNGGADSINAGAGDDYIDGGAGNDTIDGGTGNDTASFQGYKSDYTVTKGTDAGTGLKYLEVTNKTGEVDKLYNIEALQFWDGRQELSVTFNAAYDSNNWSNNNINGTGQADEIDADALAAANPFKGSKWININFAQGQTTYELGAKDFANNGTVTFTADEIQNLANSGLQLKHNSVMVSTPVTVSVTDIINRTGGAYTLHWIGTATQVNVPLWSVNFSVDVEAVNSHRDWIYGNEGNDTILAGTGDDTVYGGAGDDSIDGGSGKDTASYNGNTSDYTITNDNGVLTVKDNNTTNGDDGTDTLTNIERLQFWDGGQDLAVSFTAANYSGDWAQNTITGTLGADTINADDLALTYDGTLTTHRDWIDAGAGNDTIYAGQGGDDIKGGAGNDLIDGGPNSLLTKLLTDSYRDSWSQENRAHYDGKSTDFTVTRNSDGSFTVVDKNASDGNEGTDILTNIDTIQFGDGLNVRLTTSYQLILLRYFFSPKALVIKF